MTTSDRKAATFRAPHTTFTVCDEPERIEVELRGEYDLSSADASQLVIELVGDLIDEACRPVIVDLAAVSFFDAAGIKFLRRVDRVARLGSTSLCVRNPSADVRRLLEIVELGAMVDGT